MSYAQTDPAAAPPLLALLSASAPDAPEQVRAMRRAARDRFAASGLPTVKNELWRSTSLKPLTKLTLTADAPDIGVVDALPAVRLTEGRTRARLVLVNGRFRADLSDLTTVGREDALVAGLRTALAAAPEETARVLEAMADDADPLTCLNTAALSDGACLIVKPNADVKALIEIVHVAVGGEDAAPFSQPRLLIALAPGSRATVVEHHVGAGVGASVLNMVTQIVVADGANLRHYVAQRAASKAIHLSRTYVAVIGQARYDAFALNLGGRLARHEIAVRLDGQGASCTLDGAYMAQDDQHTDTTTRIEHASPGTTSREVYKGTVDDGAQAVFQGKIVVKPGAVKTDGHQLNRSLLLSDRAGVYAKPELEIYADDVKCSHGATVGELDDAALFFLRARGIPKEEARSLLITAFLQESVDEIADEDVRAAFAAMIEARLNRPGNAEVAHAAGN